ncbi:MAG: cytochrome c3 family protein [Vicinamibacteria bacterium]|jgi:hypothetical protein|nr:cytochrome c3 family protein [Vicinamibacteria bacterium]
MEKKARCGECHSEVLVPDSYAQGDHIKCGTCHTGLKVHRGDILRLLIADVSPLKESLRQQQERMRNLEDELQKARGSIGLGINGLLIGLAYIVWQIGLRSRDFSTGLFVEAILLSLVSGVVLEVLNFYYFAKRQVMTRLSAEIDELRQMNRQLQQKIREATRK